MSKQVGGDGASNCGGGLAALGDFPLARGKLRALNIASPSPGEFPIFLRDSRNYMWANARCDDFNDLGIRELDAANDASSAAVRQSHVDISYSESSLFFWPCYKGGTNNQPNVSTRNSLQIIDSGQAPRHEFSLCVGALRLLLRAISPIDGFSENSRLFAIEIDRALELCQSCESKKIPPVFRDRFILKSKTGLEVKRKQSPLRLAYAVTSRKCQGATLDFAVADLSTDPFSHGQLYVTLSRCREKENVAIFGAKRESGGVVFAENVIWAGALSNFGIIENPRKSVSGRVRDLFLLSDMGKGEGVRHADLDVIQFE